MELRKQDILKAVVREFTVSAVPVGSQALVSRHILNLSSATVRNELSELADLGYLVQPHTSAGRIPTDLGYRYFVDFLMESEPVSAEVRSYIESEFRRAPADIQALVERLAIAAFFVTAATVVATRSSSACGSDGACRSSPWMNDSTWAGTGSRSIRKSTK